jgi:hypothetical protein
MLIYKGVLGSVLLAQAEAAERSGLVLVESAEPELRLRFVGDSTKMKVKFIRQLISVRVRYWKQNLLL